MKKNLLKISGQKLVRGSGPASLSMVLQYYGVNADQESIADSLNDKKNQKDELLKYARKEGFSASAHKKLSMDETLDNIVKLLKKGIPPIISKNGGEEYAYCVVKGYDLERKILYFNDPNNLRRTKLGFKKFGELWAGKNKTPNYIISIKPKKK